MWLSERPFVITKKMSDEPSSTTTQLEDETLNILQKASITGFEDHGIFNECSIDSLLLVEQIYQEKLRVIQEKIQQIKNKTHVDYVHQVTKLTQEKEEKLSKNRASKNSRLEYFASDFNKKNSKICTDLKKQNYDLKQNMIADLNDRKKTVKLDNDTTKLIPESMDIKPDLPRNLKKRTKSLGLPTLLDKPRKLRPLLNIQYSLLDHEIEEDINAMSKIIPFDIDSPSAAISPRSDLDRTSAFVEMPKPRDDSKPIKVSGTMCRSTLKIKNTSYSRILDKKLQHQNK